MDWPTQVVGFDLIAGGRFWLIGDTPSYLYLNVIRESLRRHWDLAPISPSAVSKALQSRGLKVDPATGLFRM